MSHQGLYRLSGAIQWPLSGFRGSCDGLQCHIRGYKGSWGAIRWALSGTSSGPGVVLSVTPGAIQALFNGL